MSTLQEYWDACLIRAWRNHMKIVDAMNMFYSITGKRLDECQLLRTPIENIPWNISARVFTAYHLPNINERLWDQSPEKDVALLHKLSKSKYNTQKTAHRTNADRELSNEMQRNRKNRERNNLSLHAVTKRNAETDWNVVKGSVRKRIAR